MAVPTDTQQTYQTIGIREDLSDMIYNIAPTQTPVMNLIGKENCSSTFFEWQTDSLDAADGDNKNIEGDDATNDAAAPTVRPGNYVQLMDKVVQVSSSQQAVTSAGRKKELAYQLAKRSKEIKRDMESRITQNYPSAAGAAGTARETGSMESWIETNESRGATGAAGGFSAGIVAAPTDGTQRAITEDLLKGVIADCWTEGAEPTHVITGSFNKRAISGFGGIATLYRDTGQSKQQASIMGAADLYISDFGQHHIIADRFSRDRSALVIDPDYWCLAYLQSFKVEKLAKTGHSERRMLSVEWGLKCKNEKASGVVADLNIV